MKRVVCSLVVVFQIVFLLCGCAAVPDAMQSKTTLSEEEQNDKYPLITYQQLLEGKVQEGETFSIYGVVDNEIKTFNLETMMHEAWCNIDGKYIFFYFQTGSFDSEDSADTFNYENLDALNGKEGLFKFVYLGYDDTTHIPTADLVEVTIDGSVYTKEDIGDISAMRITTPVEVIDNVLYTIPEYDNSIYAAARVKNIGNQFLELDKSNCSFDIESTDGTFIYHMDSVTVAPEVLAPGEIGYITAMDIDIGADLEKCQNVITNLSYESTHAVCTSLSIEDITFAKDSWYFYATPGRVVNDNQFAEKDVIPVISLFDNNGKFLGASICHKIPEIAANSQIGFSGDSSDPIPLSAFLEGDVGDIIAFGSVVDPIE